MMVNYTTGNEVEEAYHRELSLLPVSEPCSVCETQGEYEVLEVDEDGEHRTILCDYCASWLITEILDVE